MAYKLPNLLKLERPCETTNSKQTFTTTLKVLTGIGTPSPHFWMCQLQLNCSRPERRYDILSVRCWQPPPLPSGETAPMWSCPLTRFLRPGFWRQTGPERLLWQHISLPLPLWALVGPQWYSQHLAAQWLQGGELGERVIQHQQTSVPSTFASLLSPSPISYFRSPFCLLLLLLLFHNWKPRHLHERLPLRLLQHSSDGLRSVCRRDVLKRTDTGLGSSSAGTEW